MTKLRQNHNRKGRGGSAFMIRLTVYTIALIGIAVFVMYGLNRYSKSGSSGHEYQSGPMTHSDHASSSDYEPSSGQKSMLPISNQKEEVVHHTYYSLGYNETYEFPNWVAYELTRSDLVKKNVPRAKRFNDDPEVDTKSASYYDYRGSGYTRGHMAPAGDMAFNKEAMAECFYMSNMTPQLRVLNNGIWKELEEQIRDWAYKDEKLLIVTGPLLDGIDDYIGKNKVGIPKSFFKIVVDPIGNDKKAIAYIIPHERCDLHLDKYAVTIDEVERRTGLDFFANYFDDALENSLESNINVKKWPVSQKRFKLRVNKWNHE